jgi:hypothetical protein
MGGYYPHGGRLLDKTLSSVINPGARDKHGKKSLLSQIIDAHGCVPTV